jgi:hypothetical protein
MYAERDTQTPWLSKWTTLPWLFPAGVALLIGFGAGWASGRIANEPVARASFGSLLVPNPPLSPADAPASPGEPANLGADGANADPPTKPSTAPAID